MKKNLKSFAGIAMAAAMAASTSTSIFAADLSGDFGGSVDSTAIDIELGTPTMSVRPFKSPQIVAYNTIENKDTDTTASYEVSLKGYTAVLTSASDNQMSLVAESAMSGVSGNTKAVSLKLTVGAAAASATLAGKALPADATAIKTAVAAFSGITEELTTTSQEKYAGADSQYTKATSTSKITMTATNKIAEYGIVGKMNVDGDWVVGDAITVTPIFKVAPVIS